jgi:hypothetical protein
MSSHRAAAYASIAVVGAAIVVGLYVSGSPSDQRLLRLDERRVADLMRLSSALSRYFSETGELPADLGELVDGRRLSSLPRDPVSDSSYVYMITGDEQFELCAEFSRESEYDPNENFWGHAAGRACFPFDYSDRQAVR